MATRSGATYHTVGPIGTSSSAPNAPGAIPAVSTQHELDNDASEGDALLQGVGGAGDPTRSDPQLEADLDQSPPLEDEDGGQFATVHSRRMRNSPILNPNEFPTAHTSSPGREFSATGPLLFPDWFGDNQESVIEEREEDTHNLINIEDDTVGRELYTPDESPRIPARNS
jgi:hypothetical protein